MQLDMMANPMALADMASLARRAEKAGFGALWLTESGRTAYLGCAAAAMNTERIGLGTAVAVAFPRSPMVTAVVAWELAANSAGRFTLGLGTQVKAHVERRYSTEFSPPGPRMREYVQSLRAIFAAFQEGGRLSFEGDYYSFNLLPPTWNPGPIEHPDVPVYVSAVLPWMTRMAGEVCDGVHVHPFHSPEYVAEVQMPALREGTARAGRNLAEVTLEIPVMTAVGDTEQEQARTREHARTMVAFYGSTRTYSPVFEQHGYDGLSDRLHALQRTGDMAAMTALITDEVLDCFTVTATWDALGAALVERYRDVAPSVRVMSYTAIGQVRENPDMWDRWADVARDMRTASASEGAPRKETPR